jgi:hypothetical protein
MYKLGSHPQETRNGFIALGLGKMKTIPRRKIYYLFIYLLKPANLT